MKLIVDFREEQEKESDAHIFTALNCPLPLEDDIRLIILHPQTVIVCDGCERRLNNAASVLLTHRRKRKDYCLSCFMKIGPGSSDYYYAKPNLNVSITEDGWSILGELLLISALLKFGYGKWHHIKDYLDYHGHNFTSEQIRKHYDRFYMAPEIKPVLSKCFHDCHLSPYQHEPTKIKEEVSPSEASPDDIWQAYDSKRQEHLVSFNSEAENLICDLDFSPSDSKEDVEMKMQVLEQYDYLIQERHKRQDFVVEHQMLSEKHHKLLLSEGKTKNEARNFVERFSRFMTFKEVDSLAKHLAFQETLKATILELSTGCKGDRHQTYPEKFSELLDKKQRRALLNGACPMDLKVISVSHEAKLPPEDESLLTEASALQQIRQLAFIDKNATITPLNNGNKH